MSLREAARRSNPDRVEKRIFQAVVVLCCVVPIAAGGYGIWRGLPMLGIAGAGAGADSHFRYLSGLLLGIGLGFLSTVPRIEVRSARFRLLAGIVVIGGLGRLVSVAMDGGADAATLFALAMELLVTPLLACGQARLARIAGAVRI